MMWNWILEGSKQQLLVVAEEEDAAAALKVLVEGVEMGAVEEVP